MPNQSDANIKLVYAVDNNSFFAIDVVNEGTPFDVIANIEIGGDIMQSVDGFDLRVFIRNLSQSTILVSDTVSQNLADQADPFNQEVRVNFAGGWSANDGDVLEPVASFKVRAGINSDYSTLKGNTFMVSVP
jgi:hypothetical protein